MPDSKRHDMPFDPPSSDFDYDRPRHPERRAQSEVEWISGGLRSE